MFIFIYQFCYKCFQISSKPNIHQYFHIFINWLLQLLINRMTIHLSCPRPNWLSIELSVRNRRQAYYLYAVFSETAILSLSNGFCMSIYILILNLTFKIWSCVNRIRVSETWKQVTLVNYSSQLLEPNWNP